MEISESPTQRKASLAALPRGEVFGQTVRGAPLEFLPCPGGNKILVIAGTHGEEPETTVILSRALRCLDVPLTSVACVLAANPDGLLAGTRGNANGVDLNRNLPTTDWQGGGTRYRWHIEDTAEIEIGTGLEPASEPETRALLGLIGNLKPRFILSLHAPLACIDDPEKTPAGAWLAERTGLPLVSGVGYPTPGSLGTWATENGVSLVTWEFPRKSIEELSRDYVPVLIEFFEQAESGAF